MHNVVAKPRLIQLWFSSPWHARIDKINYHHNSIVKSLLAYQRAMGKEADPKEVQKFVQNMLFRYGEEREDEDKFIFSTSVEGDEDGDGVEDNVEDFELDEDRQAPKKKPKVEPMEVEMDVA